MNHQTFEDSENVIDLLNEAIFDGLFFTHFKLIKEN